MLFGDVPLHIGEVPVAVLAYPGVGALPGPGELALGGGVCRDLDPNVFPGTGQLASHLVALALVLLCVGLADVVLRVTVRAVELPLTIIEQLPFQLGREGEEDAAVAALLADQGLAERDGLVTRHQPSPSGGEGSRTVRRGTDGPALQPLRRPPPAPLSPGSASRS